jgi:UDP-glucose 4-epimerase
MNILVTGGTGYIGSHTCVELLNAGYNVIIIDNLSNSKKETLTNIEKITGKSVKFYQNDVQNKEVLKQIFKENDISAVIHFAGFKAVGESVKKPLMYYRNNLDSTLTLLEVMNEMKVKKLVFSSSATVYGNPKTLPIKENFPLSTTNPYGSTKLMIENILRDLYTSDQDWSIAILRYFNPIGAHKSGLIGENPNDIPNNLMPYIVKVATGKLECLNIFGNDYNTKDGTGVRDYIHVVDLAKGHIKAIEKILKTSGIDAYNLGTGQGYSVLEIVNTFSKINNVKVNYKIAPRRPGDIDACYADVSYAKAKLGFTAKLGIKEMCQDAYNYSINQKKKN